MLHGHPIATENSIVNSTYSDVNLPGLLRGYDPCNPDKPFRYAITQWNLGNPNAEHVDWLSFSSTIQPDWIDNGTYNGHNGKPASGTHIRIENHQLNGAKWIYCAQAAGAMSWNLGTLAPGQSKSITLAVMFGSGKNVQLSEPNVWNKTKDSYYTTISDAVGNADQGNEIVVYPGLYSENVDFGTKSITLRSVDPNNWSVVNSTIIYGSYSGDATINLANNNNCVISGLTIIYGDPAGISCDNSNPTINCCQIKANIYGISCNNSNPTINRCQINNNTEGIHCENYSNPTINRCGIEDNRSSGIRAYNTDIVVDRCEIANNGTNVSYRSGIDVHDGNAVITNNIIHHNIGFSGVYLSNVRSAEIRNNTIADNSYGIYRSDGNDPNINSNIIWGNDYSNLYVESGSFNKVSYNCIQNYTGGTNINIDPCFVDANANDYHLKMNSNCIDRGDPCFTDTNQVDIDSEDRIMDGDNNGVFRVDIGADEFCPYDLSLDGFVNFRDFTIFAKSWKTSDGNANYNYLCDYFPDSKIDYKDLYVFCNHWLWPFDGNNISGSGEMMMSMESEQEFLSESMVLQEDDQQSMMAGEGETASIYLICDVNEPNNGDEVTVQVYSDVPLLGMDLGITITGDANITSAVSTADCDEYGWDPSWPTDPLIDPTGWVYIHGVKWDADAEGVVGYIKFRYNSGQVSVSITEGEAFNADCASALFSGEALTFGESE